MTKLTDTQAIILSAASQRDGNVALPLPDSLRGGAAAKVVGAMLAKGFLEEVAADTRNGEAVWRETGDGHGVTLVATDAGLAAIGIETDNPNIVPAENPEPKPRTPRGHQTGHAHRHVARARRCNHRRDHGRNRMAVAYRARRNVRCAQEEARARSDLGKGRGSGSRVQNRVVTLGIGEAARHQLSGPSGYTIFTCFGYFT